MPADVCRLGEEGLDSPGMEAMIGFGQAPASPRWPEPAEPPSQRTLPYGNFSRKASPSPNCCNEWPLADPNRSEEKYAAAVSFSARHADV
jgi:hypothetical protein